MVQTITLEDFEKALDGIPKDIDQQPGNSRVDWIREALQFKGSDTEYHNWLQGMLDLYDAELDHYGSILKPTTMVCIHGDDGTLQYVYQCQVTGDIICTNHGQEESVRYRVLSPRANGLPIDASPFRVLKRGTLLWIASMYAAKGDSEQGYKYITCDYDKCRFKLTWFHRVRYHVQLFFLNLIHSRRLFKGEKYDVLFKGEKNHDI